jgi:hypothetical protein
MNHKKVVAQKQIRYQLNHKMAPHAILWFKSSSDKKSAS